MLFAVCAPGVSLTTEQIDQLVTAKVPIVAAADAVRLTHHCAVAVAATDGAWWKQYPQWQRLTCRKFTLAPDWHKLPADIERLPGGQSGSNSALFAIMVARHLGATRVLLVGVDLHSPGEHFFGKHPAKLRSSTAARFEVFKQQFLQYRPRGFPIINCTPNSALHCYPRCNLADMLAQPALLPTS